MSLQNGDLFMQQIALDQRRAQFDLEPIALQFLARRGLRGQRRLAGRQERVALAAERGGGYAKTSGDGLEVFATQ